ncbi:hypothetical protein, partial [Thiolapillus sp.]|uniref:hypothetical protein n=1 Tax=Thiolapillus sp. TaxID=2017437 RepID=UPI003AF610D7
MFYVSYSFLAVSRDPLVIGRVFLCARGSFLNVSRDFVVSRGFLYVIRKFLLNVSLRGVLVRR